MLYYKKESIDVKNNTVRRIDVSNERFTQLIAWMELNWNDGYIKIKIINNFNEKYFISNIRDICIWEDFMIITWNVKANREKKIWRKEMEDVGILFPKDINELKRLLLEEKTGEIYD